MLHRAVAIDLPPVCYTPPNPRAKRQPPVAMLIDETPIQGRLSQLQPIEFQQVRHTGDEALCNSLMEQHHYFFLDNRRLIEPLEISYFVFGWTRLNRRRSCGTSTKSRRFCGISKRSGKVRSLDFSTPRPFP